jgi:hypothetical protein
MRRSYCTVTPAAVRAAAAASLRAALPWRPFRASVTVAALLDLLLLTAALRSSLSAVARRFGFGFGHETARRALSANLPPPDRLAEGLVDALHASLPRAFRRRAWDVAVDLHYVPFYGSARTPGALGGPKKGGTNRFFAYATAVAVQRGQRWCLGLVPVRTARAEIAAGALAGQLRARGVRARCLLLDRGFFSGHVIRALQERRLPFVVGVPRRAGPGNRLSRLFERPSGQVTTYAGTTGRGSRRVQTTVVAVRRRVRGRWRREVHAFEGVGPAGAVRRHQRARYFRELYRRRFGIETSYRQLNQGRARTTSPGPRRRRLGVGVALLLRQVWVWLQQHLAPRGTNWRRWRPRPQLRVAVVLDWLAGQLQRRHPAARSIPVPQPLVLPVAIALSR